jgi:hypothetical protein
MSTRELAVVSRCCQSIEPTSEFTIDDSFADKVWRLLSNTRLPNAMHADASFRSVRLCALVAR